MSRLQCRFPKKVKITLPVRIYGLSTSILLVCCTLPLVVGKKAFYNIYDRLMPNEKFVRNDIVNVWGIYNPYYNMVCIVQ